MADRSREISVAVACVRALVRGFIPSYAVKQANKTAGESRARNDDYDGITGR